MKVYFARHGESQANVLHEISNRGLRHGLTPKGRVQAAALAERLQACSITHVYSSPVLRAIETSIIVANRLGIEYEITAALKEYDCGIAEGRSDDAAWQMWQELLNAWIVDKQWEDRIDGGESFIDIRERFVPFVDSLIDRHKESNLLCLSHGGVYSMMLPLVLQNVDHELIATRGFDYTGCVVGEMRSTGLVCVEWGGQPC